MTNSELLNTEDKTITLSYRIAVACLGGTLGIFILLGVGFANAHLIHNAAHDARHLNSFACH